MRGPAVEKSIDLREKAALLLLAEGWRDSEDPDLRVVGKFRQIGSWHVWKPKLNSGP
jgi:hypothetical protein